MKLSHHQRWITDSTKAAGLLVLLLSPLGAPLIGHALIAACDIPWEGSFHCAVPGRLLNYFLRFAILSWIWVGPFLALLWLVTAFGMFIGCLWFFGAAIWGLAMERL